MVNRGRRLDVNGRARLSGEVRTLRIPVPGLRTLGVCAFAALIAIGAAAWATFASSVIVTNTISSGTMTLVAGATGAKTNRFDISATDMAAGDTVQRTLDLTVGGTITNKELDLLLTASPSTALDTNAAGLTIFIEKCSVAWTEAGSNPAYTSTCSGTQTTVWAVEAVSVMKARTTFALIPTAVSSTLFLKITLTLPTGLTTANTELATFGSLSSTLSFAFSAVQRVGTSR